MSTQKLNKLFHELSPEGQKSIMETLEERRQADMEKSIKMKIANFTPEERKEFAEAIGRGTKRSKTPKDPNKPKGVKKAYFFFADKIVPEIKKKEEDIDHKAAMTKAGALWKQLSDDQKKPFQELEAEDQARFDEEMKTYDPSAFDPNTVPLKKGRTKKAKDAPKSARSAYILFSSEKRKQLAEEGTPKKETLAAAAALWKEMTDEQKKPYEDRHLEDKARYEREMEAYKQKAALEAPTQEMDESE